MPGVSALRTIPVRVSVAVALLITIHFLFKPAPVAAQIIENDTIPLIHVDSLVVSVLGSPVRIGESAYPISVVGKTELREGKTGMFLEEALEGLPGVQVQNRFNYAVGERISIRGFGARSPFGVRGIHVVVDGIPATLPDGQSTLDHVNIGSLGRVEALRGPASALYGNASGGVLRFETEIPSQVGARNELTTVAGSDGLLRVQNTTSGTVGSTGYLFSVNRLSYEGFRRTQSGDPYGSAERYHVNSRLVTSLGSGELGISLNHLDLDAENPGSLRLDLLEEDPRQVFAPAYTNNQTGKEIQQTQAGFTWTGPVGGLTVETAVYGLVRDFLNPLPGDIVDVYRKAVGARVTLGNPTEDRVNIRGGVDINLQDDDRREYGNNDGERGSIQQDETQYVRGIGVFLQTSLSMNESISLTAAVRYDRSLFKADDHFPVTAGVNEDDSGERTLDAFSPTVGIHVVVGPEVGLFANYSRSFQTPTTVELGNRESGAGGFNPSLGPQTGKTFEMGVRGIASDHVSYELALFNTRLHNELIAFENVDLVKYYRNAGSTTRTGAEAILRARLSDFASVQGAYTYTKARFSDYTTKSGDDLSGKKVPGLAPQQVQGSIRLGPDAWYLVLATEYTDEIPVTDSNSAPFADAYNLFDVRVGLSAIQLGPFELIPSAGIQNLFDKTFVSSVAINAWGNRYYEPGPRRTFYLGGTLALGH